MFIQAHYSTCHIHWHMFLLAYMKCIIFFLTYTWASVFIVQCRCVERTGVVVSTSWYCAVSLGSDYGAWCRLTVCRLSCTATLILSINNNPPHCHPEPHLLITICHLSDAPPSPSPFLLPSLSLAVFSSSIPPSRASYPLHLPIARPPTPHPSSACVQLRDMVQHTEECSPPSPTLSCSITLTALWKESD